LRSKSWLLSLPYTIREVAVASLIYSVIKKNKHMKRVGVYNNIPKELKVEPIRKGTTMLYRLVNYSVDNSDPTKPNRKVWPKAIKIPTLDRILDPNTNEVIPIGVVNTVDRDGNPSIDTFWVRGMENDGYFLLSGDSIKDQYYHWYFSLCNFNRSNPKRDTSIDALFEVVDAPGDARKELKKLDIELEALLYVRDMNREDLKTFAAALGWNEKEDADILRNMAKDLAKRDPVAFNKIITNKDMELKAFIKRAKDAGTIMHDNKQNKVVWTVNNETIATFPRVEGVNWITQMADWIKTSKNGDSTLAAIKKSVTTNGMEVQELEEESRRKK
jgi:hypothetical protein